MRTRIELPPAELRRLKSAKATEHRLRRDADLVMLREVRRLTSKGYPLAAIARGLGITRSAMSASMKRRG